MENSDDALHEAEHRTFEKIEKGEKTIELRLFDEKRRTVRTGDIIEFSCAGVDYKLKA